MSVFEVIRDGAVIMHTTDADCLYPVETLKQMQSAGYQFRLGGRAWKPSEGLKETADGQLML